MFNNGNIEISYEWKDHVDYVVLIVFVNEIELTFRILQNS